MKPKSSSNSKFILVNNLCHQQMVQYEFDLLAVYSANGDLIDHQQSTKIPDPKPESSKTINDFNPDVVTTMLIEWGQPKREPQGMKDDSGSLSMAESMTVAGMATMSLEHYEPVRLCSFAAPPKRFYRTFWRSVARRLLERQT